MRVDAKQRTALFEWKAMFCNDDIEAAQAARKSVVAKKPRELNESTFSSRYSFCYESVKLSLTAA